MSPSWKSDGGCGASSYDKYTSISELSRSIHVMRLNRTAGLMVTRSFRIVTVLATLAIVFTLSLRLSLTSEKFPFVMALAAMQPTSNALSQFTVLPAIMPVDRHTTDSHVYMNGECHLRWKCKLKPNKTKSHQNKKNKKKTDKTNISTSAYEKSIQQSKFIGLE